MIRFAVLAFAAGALLAQEPAPFSQETELTIKLTAGVSSKSNKPGDTITAVVVTPGEWKDSLVEGEVKQAKASGAVNKKSELLLGFHTIVRKDQQIPVSAAVKRMANSKGQADVDEEGRVVERKGNAGKVALMTGGAAILGGVLGGAKGAAIGAGAGAAASLLFVSLGTKGPDIRFDPGSELVLSVKARARQGQPQ